MSSIQRDDAGWHDGGRHGHRTPDHEPVEVISVDRLSAGDVYEVMALTRAAGDADGAFPLSEHVTLHLRRGGNLPAVHLLGRSGAELVGYAHVDTTDLVEGASAELCVHPLHRRRGLGRALVVAAMAAADALDADALAAVHGAAAPPAGRIRGEVRDPAGRLRLWAHGDHPSANAMALSLGFTRSRVLWQMRRSLALAVPAAELPPGVHLRPFRPGLDDAAWLDLNARAFADLPDQGRWTAPDLAARLAESWFDADGFLLAVRADATLAGFHWTKVHGGARHGGGESHHHEPIGEVYVLGVDPVAHGTGLGTTLTLAGLRHLRDRGLNQVMLYVDESNPQALALYRKLGFARWSTDVLFSRRA